MDGGNAGAHGADWFDQSLAAALIVGVGGGLLLIAVGLAIAMNWHGWADRHSYWTGLFLPARRPYFDERLVRQNRVIFGVVAGLGALLFVGGLIAVLR